MSHIAPDLATYDVHPPLYFGLLHGWLAITGQQRLDGARAQPGVRGAHHPRHLRAGARPGVQTARGRAGRARLGGEPRRGQHLVAHPPVRPRRPDDGAARLGAGARGHAAARAARRDGVRAGRGSTSSGWPPPPPRRSSRTTRPCCWSPAASSTVLAGVAPARQDARRRPWWPPLLGAGRRERSPPRCSRRAGRAPSAVSAPSSMASPLSGVVREARRHRPDARPVRRPAPRRSWSRAAVVVVLVLLLVVPRTRRALVGQHAHRQAGLVDDPLLPRWSRPAASACRTCSS